MSKKRRGARLTTAHKYMKGAVASRGKQIFFYLYQSKYVSSNRFGLERKIITLFTYRNSRKNHQAVQKMYYCTFFFSR